MDALHVGEEFGVVGFLLVPMYNTIPETGFGGICKKILEIYNCKNILKSVKAIKGSNGLFSQIREQSYWLLL